MNARVASEFAEERGQLVDDLLFDLRKTIGRTAQPQMKNVTKQFAGLRSLGAATFVWDAKHPVDDSGVRIHARITEVEHAFEVRGLEHRGDVRLTQKENAFRLVQRRPVLSMVAETVDGVDGAGHLQLHFANPDRGVRRGRPDVSKI